MKSIFKLIGKILGIVVASVLALVVLVWGGLNLAKFAIYNEYYSMKENVCKNPGLNDGFVCQGVAVLEEDSRIFVSGYMKDGSASRVYVTDRENNAHYITLMQNGEPFTGHVGGIAVHGDTVYLANDGRLHLMSAASFIHAKNGAVFEVGEGIEVNNAASFVFADDTHVYVGEFHDGGKYVTDHPYDTPHGTQYAIMTRYCHEVLDTPDRVYSIRDKVQGVCLDSKGQIIFSTSYGLTDSRYYVYDGNNATESGLTLDGAPVFYLGECVREFKGPAMSEGLDYADGKVFTLTESASDKYIFGKFFFANHIVSLELE